jgi:hypothetical protein
MAGSFMAATLSEPRFSERIPRFLKGKGAKNPYLQRPLRFGMIFAPH